MKKTEELKNLSHQELVSYYDQKATLLKDLGFNLNFAPCVDKFYEQSFIAQRSFSSDIHQIIELASIYLEEFSKKNKLINEVSVYCGSYLPNWRPNKDFRATYSAHEAQGGGVHLDLFHELDYLCWILGMPTSAYGIRRNVSSLAIDASDYAHYLLFYEHFTATATLNYYRTDTKRTMEIVFDNTTWSVDLLKNEITDHRKNIIYGTIFNV